MAVAWLDGLNPAQREAVTHGDGPLLVVAGAGTGKTKTLACRVAYLIDQGVSPDRILLLTFTRRASAEMLKRAEQMVARKTDAKVWGGTFHAVANRLLRIYGPAIGLPDDFTVMDEGDAAELIGLVRNELGAAKKERRFAQKRTLLKIYSRMVNAQEQLSDTLAAHFPWCKDDIEGIKPIFDLYSSRKQDQHLLDYDDLLLFWSALCSAPGVGESVADRFDHVLVDEYQDTNVVQAELLRGMRKKNGNIMVVGDDAQSIYSFRAATVRNILDFPKHFEGTRVVTLEQNYRSTQPILAASNAVMANARERYTKELWSDRRSLVKPVLTTCVDEVQQCEVVCGHILEHLEQDIPLIRQAVLSRASSHSAQLEIELSRRNIPFHKFGGLKFVETAHLKDMLALLRVLENPYDEISWFRILQLLDGIGPKIAGRIIDAIGVRGRPAGRGSRRSGGSKRNGHTRSPSAEGSASSPLARLFMDPPPVPSAAGEQFTRLRSTLAQCCGMSLRESDDQEKTPPTKEPALTTQIERIRQFYEPIFEQIFDNATIRLRDIEQLAQIAAGYRSRHRFIVDLTLDPPKATSDLAGPPFLEEDYLTLSTIHSAKGCEWDVVCIIHAADGMIPSDMALGDGRRNQAAAAEGVEEERRLLYVAMTRAKDWLYVTFPLRYYHRGRGLSDAHGYAQLSRFISETNPDLFATETAAINEENDEAISQRTTADPYARTRRLWKAED